MKTFFHEFWIFGLKQAYACLFGGFLLAAIMITGFWYPEDPVIYRYDLLFLLAVAFQVGLLAFRLETPREAIVILLFHIVATVMEVFKTSESIDSWRYPGEFNIGIYNVPLFAGFMYSAVGSYIARVWRLFDFRFSYYPPAGLTWIVVALIYINFFSHHFVFDIRWILLAATVAMFFRCNIYFKICDKHRHMSLLLGWSLVALFIWFAENVGTYSKIWLYPTQATGWHIVSISKLISWFLLMILSFVLVAAVQKPKIYSAEAEMQSDSEICY